MEDDRVPQVYASAATTNHNCSIGIGCMSSKRKGPTTKKKVGKTFITLAILSTILYRCNTMSIYLHEMTIENGH